MGLGLFLEKKMAFQATMCFVPSARDLLNFCKGLILLRFPNIPALSSKIPVFALLLTSVRLEF